MQKMILMVDDDPEDIQLFCSALYECNKPYYCISVSSGEAALQFLSSTFILPDFIFMDLNMPRLNGKECLIQIKKESQFNNIPIIIYSTTSQNGEVEKLYRLGADYFFTKPVKTEVLVETISEILNGHLLKATGYL
jgi:CheY-like chemotaxis protein